MLTSLYEGSQQGSYTPKKKEVVKSKICYTTLKGKTVCK